MLQVECTQDSRGELAPTVIWFGARRVEVRAVTDRWYGTAQRWWKVETDEGAYVLRLDEASRTWELAAVVGT
mgnify:CR=1 FL=1